MSRMSNLDFIDAACQLVLERMFDGPHLDICVVDAVLKVRDRAVRDSEEYRCLEVLHVTKWAGMDKALRDEIRGRVLRLTDMYWMDLDEAHRPKESSR